MKDNLIRLSEALDNYVRLGSFPVGIRMVKEGESLPDKVVKVKRFPVKLMPVDEAIEQMELLDHDFFLFHNEETQELNLLYRRKDGNYSIIEPELD